jgi:hypothetical protein
LCPSVTLGAADERRARHAYRAQHDDRDDEHRGARAART